MRASSKALNPHSYADSFSGSGCRYATMKGATRSTSPITSEIPIKIARGRYSCSSAFIFTSLHPRREPQRAHNRFPRPGGPAPPTRLGKSWIRSTAGDKTRLSAAHHRWQVDVDVAAAPDADIAMGAGMRMGVTINRASCGDLCRRREPIAIKAPHPGRVKNLESALTDRQPHPFLPAGAGQDGEEGPFADFIPHQTCRPDPAKTMHFHHDGDRIKGRRPILIRRPLPTPHAGESRDGAATTPRR